MRSLPRSVLLTASLLSFFLGVDPSSTAEEPDSTATANQEEIIQRILQLRRQIEDLLEILPEDLRRQVEQRWQTSQAERVGEATPDPGATQPGEPATESATALEEPIEDLPATAVVPPCGGFHLFDTNEDALVTAGDRPWRYLRLWLDANGDDSLEESEIESLFELGVRQIDVGLRFYGKEESDSEDIDIDDLIWLRGLGKGDANRRSGALVVAADRLARDGRLWLIDAEGTQLSGYQLLGSGALLDTSEGERFPVLCQASKQTP